MTTPDRSGNASSSPRRRRGFRLAAIALSVLAGLLIAEGALRWQQSRIENSDQLDLGLVAHDDLLGWIQVPNWTGNHHHHDFSVRYSVNRHGFRADSPDPSQKRGKLVAVVGDSFAFGLGVNDHETFVARLNARFTNQVTFVNFGVVGYSTDQECLLINQLAVAWKPDVVLVQVYLGNDLLDNERPFPLQLDHAKPYFTLGPSDLVLQHLPVPNQARPPELAHQDLLDVLLDQDQRRQPREVLARYSVLCRRLFDRFWTPPDKTPFFSQRFATASTLFGQLLGRIRDSCANRGIRLVLAVLPGRSFFDAPGSYSAQSQSVFKRTVEAEAARLQIPFIEIRLAVPQGSVPLFHPNEGHLTPAGHETVADQLAQSFFWDEPASPRSD